jgi:hypothetical protein
MAMWGASPDEQLLSPGEYSNQSASLLDEYAHGTRFQELHSTLRSYLFVEAQSAGNTRQQTPEVHDNFLPGEWGPQLLGQHLAECDDQVPLPKKIQYLNTWMSECAPWLDMFDQERHFGIQIPALAQRSNAVLYAMLALAARQTERHAGSAESSKDSLELYSRAISSLAPSINARDPEVVITACVLCVLEMMSVSPSDWRRHSEGCAALFESLGVHGFSGGLLQAVFWCYARMDLCAAIIADGTERPTLPIDKWAIVSTNSLAFTDGQIDPKQSITQIFLEKGGIVPDMHANYAVYLCARVCDLLAQRTRYLELDEDNGCTDDTFRQLWNDLWEELQQWLEMRPLQMQPVQDVDHLQDEQRFPSILFAHWAAISGNQIYHTACILMMEMAPLPTNTEFGVDTHSALWHARRVVGISLTNPHRGCLNNAIQPLYVAGKLFTHRTEHKIIIDLLNHIEACSGWGSRWRIKDLEIFWGYRSGRRLVSKVP